MTFERVILVTAPDGTRYCVYRLTEDLSRWYRINDDDTYDYIEPRKES